VSAKGALGLMQLMPSTAKRFGVTDYFDPKQNIQGGAKYLAYLLKLFDNNKSLAVAAYNAGEKSVIKYGLQIPPYKETIGYVAKVNAVY
jgi:soluble lytic murein transglycosylase-like protein